MPTGRNVVLLLGLATAAPALAQGTPAKSGSGDIVISGATGEKMSDWKRAEADHVVVYSDGTEKELKRVTNDLEALYRIMSRIYRRTAAPDETVKLQVTLFSSADFLRTMGPHQQRGDEGSYSGAFASHIYYDPRDEGEVLAVARDDQVIDLNTNKARNDDCDNQLAEGAPDCHDVPDRPPVGREWEAQLYSAFAQHFIMSYMPAAYPRWYVDGVGALFSTFDVRSNGAVNFAAAPEKYLQFFRSYGVPKVADILTGHYLDPGYSDTEWTPYHAWLIAHYFLFSKLKPERDKQFMQYMTAVHQGVPMAEAAKAFGDMKRLQHEIVVYARNSTAFAHMNPPPEKEEAPLVTRLTMSAAAMIGPKVELGARLAGDDKGREDWLGQLRAKVAQLPYDADALLVQAEAECRSGHADECLAAAQRVLDRAPDNVRALAWKGIALTDKALAGPAASRAATLEAGRQAIRHANHLDNRAPLPLVAYFQSFTKAGEPVPDIAMQGIALAARYVPAAPGPRLYLAQELIRQGKADVARSVIYPVLYGAEETPEKKQAQQLFAVR